MSHLNLLNISSKIIYSVYNIIFFSKDLISLARTVEYEPSAQFDYIIETSKKFVLVYGLYVHKLF